MERNEVDFLQSGYKEIIELVEENVEIEGGLYSPEELLEKILEISEIRLMGEL